ncbi:MAG: 3'-5' exoribonuclease YhaM family protein [Nitrospinota bacterium]
MPWIAELDEGQRVVEFFLVRDKQVRLKRSGEEYLTLVLQDRTGFLNAVCWDEVATRKELVSVGEIIKVDGMVGLYNEELQLTVYRLRPVEERDHAEGLDPARFFPETDHDVEAMWRELLDHVAEVAQPDLRTLLERLCEKHAEAFKTYPGAMEIHHSVLGGFLEHTLSVVKSCLYFASKYPDLDRDLLVAGAVCHDIGKLKELTIRPTFSYTEAGHLIGHVLLGRDMVHEVARTIDGFPEDLLLKLDHLIVSHQGEPAFGSPKVPMTREALVLHFADNLDAKVNIMQRHLAEDPTEGPFTAWHHVLGRRLYKR